MSKRFGRNQRRRAREALAAAASEAERFKTAHAMTSGLLEHVAASKRDLEQEIEEAKAMVGPYSALFSPVTTKQDRQAHHGARFRTPALGGAVDFPFDEIGDEPIAQQVVHVIDLPGMLASVPHDEAHPVVPFRPPVLIRVLGKNQVERLAGIPPFPGMEHQGDDRVLCRCFSSLY